MNRTDNRKKILWSLISLLIAVGSVFMVLNKSKHFELDEFFDSLEAMNDGWLLMAIVCMFGFIWFEGLAVVKIAKSLNVHKKIRQGLVYGAADVYFSAITPSASGGQPASAYFMMRDGMTASEVAITLLFNLIFYCLALLTVAALNFCLFWDILFELSLKFKILYFLGMTILIMLAICFYLLINKGQIIYRFCDKLLDLGERLHIVKNGEVRRDKLLKSMDQYHECAAIIAKDHRVVYEAYIYNVLQRLSQLGVSFCIFMAWKPDLGLAFKAFATQSFVAVGSNCIPIPGAMGVADYLMLNGFTHLLGESMAVTMELICRGITFYGCVLTGGIITAIGYLVRRGK